MKKMMSVLILSGVLMMGQASAGGSSFVALGQCPANATTLSSWGYWFMRYSNCQCNGDYLPNSGSCQLDCNTRYAPPSGGYPTLTKITSNNNCAACRGTWDGNVNKCFVEVSNLN